MSQSLAEQPHGQAVGLLALQFAAFLQVAEVFLPAPFEDGHVTQYAVETLHRVVIANVVGRQVVAHVARHLSGQAQQLGPVTGGVKFDDRQVHLVGVPRQIVLPLDHGSVGGDTGKGKTGQHGEPL